MWVTKLELRYDTKKTRKQGLQDVYQQIAQWANDTEAVVKAVVFDGIDVSGTARILSVYANNKDYEYRISAAKGYVSLQRIDLMAYGFETKQVIYGQE
jgi:hypothetical protein